MDDDPDRIPDRELCVVLLDVARRLARVLYLWMEICNEISTQSPHDIFTDAVRSNKQPLA